MEARQLFGAYTGTARRHGAVFHHAVGFPTMLCHIREPAQFWLSSATDVADGAALGDYWRNVGVATGGYSGRSLGSYRLLTLAASDKKQGRTHG